jgi:hypothetical protein
MSPYGYRNVGKIWENNRVYKVCFFIHGHKYVLTAATGYSYAAHVYFFAQTFLDLFAY